MQAAKTSTGPSIGGTKRQQAAVRAEESLALNDLIYRQTSPYFPSDPYILLGEYLILNYPGCRFAGFEIASESRKPDFVYVGISVEDRNHCSIALQEAMTAPRFSLTRHSQKLKLAREVPAWIREQFAAQGIHLPSSAALEKTHGLWIVVWDGEARYALEKEAKGANLMVSPIVQAKFYHQWRPVICRRITLDLFDYENEINQMKQERYWVNDHVSAYLESAFNNYAKHLSKRIQKIVLFCDFSGSQEFANKWNSSNVAKAIVNSFPIPNGALLDATVPTLPIDDIDVMRWFANNFETTWHLQPNEQMGFLVLETRSYSDLPQSDLRAGEKLGFEGWLVYKYTGNLFLKGPESIAELLTNVRNLVSATGNKLDTAEEHRRVANTVTLEFLEKQFQTLASRVLQSLMNDQSRTVQDLKNELEEVASEIRNSTAPLDVAQRGLTQLAERKTNGVGRKLFDGALAAIKALATMRTHLLNAIDNVNRELKEFRANSDWVRPILRARDLERTRTKDSEHIQKYFHLLCRKDLASAGNAISVLAKEPTDNEVATFFYMTLLFRRVLLEIPQTLEIGFAPYFMEVGFADPEVLTDTDGFDPRKDADLSKTISDERDAMYKLLGTVERLFGIGGRGEWTFYMAAAPFFGHGQRRGFIFVGGYYHRDWLKELNAERQQRSRLNFLSRLLRANSYYVGRELQEAYNRKFREEMKRCLGQTGNSFESGLRQFMYYLCNLSDRVTIDNDSNVPTVSGIEVDKVLSFPLSSNGVQRSLSIPLLPGENENFVRSGVFHLMCTLSDAASLSDVKAAVTVDMEKKVGEFLRTSAHNLSQILGKGALAFDEAVVHLRSRAPQGPLVYAQAQSLIPSLSCYFSLLRREFRSQESRPYPLVLPIIDGFRRAVNLYFAQRGMRRMSSESFEFSDDAIRKEVDRFPWTLGIRLNDGVEFSLDYRLYDNSPLRALATSTKTVAAERVPLWGLIPETDSPEWQDVTLEEQTTFVESLSTLTTNSYLGLVVIMQELFYNACMHGERRSLEVDISASHRMRRVVLRNICTRGNQPLEASVKHGLGTTKAFAQILGMEFDFEYEERDADLIFNSTISLSEGN
jgi:hypothetical protein